MFNFRNPFKKPPANVFAQDTLEEYSHQHIVSKEASEYHAKMADFYKQGMKRMQEVLAMKNGSDGGAGKVTFLAQE